MPPGGTCRSFRRVKVFMTHKGTFVGFAENTPNGYAMSPRTDVTGIVSWLKQQAADNQYSEAVPFGLVIARSLLFLLGDTIAARAQRLEQLKKDYERMRTALSRIT